MLVQDIKKKFSNTLKEIQENTAKEVEVLKEIQKNTTKQVRKNYPRPKKGSRNNKENPK